MSARLQNLRNLLSTNSSHTAAEQRRALEALDQEVDHMNHEQRHDSFSQLAATSQELSRSTERRRTLGDSLLNSDDRATIRHPPPLPPGMNPSNLVRTRRRAFRPSERLTRSQRERLGQGGSLMPSPSYSTLPPRPSPPPQNAEALREYAGEAQANRESRYRAKRRKLDDGTYEDESKAITYGWNGQVVPGQLKLDIVSCDGGEYQDPRAELNSFPQNVLKDDGLVYCTKSNKCNMLLKHSSGMPFTLTKMIIKAPRSGYDAPLQEGMIFVALDDQDLAEKTARYEINYSPKSSLRHRQRLMAMRLDYEERMMARSPLRSIDRSRYLRDPRQPPPAWHRYEGNDPVLDSNVIPGFTVTTDDPSDDEHTPTERHSSLPPWHDADPEYPYRSYADRYRPVYAENDRPAGYEYSAPTSDSEDGEETLLDDLIRTTGRLARTDSPGLDLDLDPGDDAHPFDEFRSSGADRRSTPSRIGLSQSERYDNQPYSRGYDLLGAEPGASSSKPQGDPAAATSSAIASDTLAPHARIFHPDEQEQCSCQI